MPTSRRVLVPALLTPFVLAVGGCGAVEVAVPQAADGRDCRAAAEHWPETVSGESVVETDPSDPAVRAWGDPAIIARCGVSAMGPTTEQCIEVSGVDWVAEELSDGTRMTTFGREPAIEVIVPEEYGPAPLLLPAFGDAAGEMSRNDLSCS